MFHYAVNFNRYIGDWNVSSVTDMQSMFRGAKKFNQDIGHWNVSAVLDMNGMFSSAEKFNQNIGNWNVSAVLDMNGMFRQAYDFNQNIGNWNVANVTNMNAMFSSASSFNQDIGNWNVAQVTDMSWMFNFAENFNHDIGNWNVAQVTDMDYMFNYTNQFNQDIGDWNVSKLSSDISLNETNLSVSNYDSLLIGWNKNNLNSNIDLDAGDSIYCQGEAARDSLIANYDWIIDDNGKDCTMYITTPNEITVKSGETFVANVHHSLALVPINSTFYSISGGADAEKFTISLFTGKLTFIDAPDFHHPADSNKDNVYRVQVKVYNSSVEREDCKTIKVKVTQNDVTLTPVIMYLLN